MRVIRTVVGAAVGLAAWVFSTPALADPATANSIELGVGFRYGIDTTKTDEQIDPWGIGLGLNGGYTLSSAIYLGGNIEYFFGGHEGDDINGPSGNIWQLTAEGGDDLGLGPIFVLRPKLGAGLANLHDKLCNSGECTSNDRSRFALLPGATFILMPPGFRLSADVRYEFVFADGTPQALILTGGIGF